MYETKKITRKKDAWLCELSNSIAESKELLKMLNRESFPKYLNS